MTTSSLPPTFRRAAGCLGLALVLTVAGCSDDESEGAQPTTTNQVPPTVEGDLDSTTTTTEAVGPVNCSVLKPASEALAAGTSTNPAGDVAAVRGQNPPKVVAAFLDGAQNDPDALKVNENSGAPTPLSEWTAAMCP